MNENYRTLGDYIEIIDERNKGLAFDNLLGISIAKKFIPSIANIVGTDLSNYKIVRTGQFAYGPVTSRNGEKISIAFLDGDDCIISSSYTVFRVIKENELAPEYLMLWFSRPEFDRYARYKSHGSVREIFDWNEMCMVKLPVPDINKQRNIVKAYKAITDRIALKQKINDNLEQQAQAIYYNFISSKTYNGILKDIIIENKKSKIKVNEAKNTKGKYPFFTSGEAILEYNTYLVDNKNIYLNTGGNADIKYYIGKASYSTDTWSIKAIDNLTDYCYLFLKTMKNEINSIYFEGSALKHLQKKKLLEKQIYIPNKTEIQDLNSLLMPIFEMISKNTSENRHLIYIRDILLPKLISDELDVSVIDL